VLAWLRAALSVACEENGAGNDGEAFDATAGSRAAIKNTMPLRVERITDTGNFTAIL
jgi:hypothetical protein